MEKYDGNDAYPTAFATEAPTRQRKAEVMYEAGLWIAAGIGCLSLLLGSRTAIPLLASFGLATYLCWKQVDFRPEIWAGIDIAVILAIVAISELRRSEWLIIYLFGVAWIGYAFPPETRFWISWAVVIAQFLLTMPWSEAWNRTVHVNRHFDPWSHLDLRAYA